MEYSELIQKIENGKQVSITGITNTNDGEFFYTYALQKINGKYISYTAEYYSDELDYDYPEVFDEFEIYENAGQIFEKFQNKYNIRPEDMNTSRGNKFFDEKSLHLVEYTGESNSELTHGKIYNVQFTEYGKFGIVNDDDIEALYIPELFTDFLNMNQKAMDITGYIVTAESYSGNEFNEIINYIKVNYNIDYVSYESGEEWAIISDGHGKMFMLHAKLKIMFTNEKNYPERLHDVYALYFSKYSEKLWSIRTDDLPPEFNWHTKEIDCDFFSTQDLYYATH
ncbi:MAG: hypothetical protein NC177_17580 [Ruminococcus flavefaciens]|nr:hypothetical protein [Ruminococcus flavefaciens]